MTDANSCSSVTSTLIAVNTNPVVNIVASSTNICSGQSKILTANASGTITSYSWNNAASGMTISVTPFTNTLYEVTVTDANGCMAADDIMIIVTQPFSLDTTVTHVSCYGYSDGEIDLSVIGSSGPFSYNWSNNVTNQDLTGLAAGTYSVTVSEASCGVTATVVITEPEELQLSVQHQDAKCHGDSSGTIDLTLEGGTPGYTYLWNGVLLSEDITGIPAGSYSVIVTDNNLCSASINDILIDEPLQFNLSGIIEDVSCNGYADGAVTLSASGGTPAYSYLWNDGATSVVRSDLEPGTYSIIATDNNSCTASISVMLTNPPGLSVSSEELNPTCRNNGGDGSIVLNVSSALPPYEFNWSNGSDDRENRNLEPGNYSVTVTDANGCFEEYSFTLTYQYDFSVHASDSITIMLGETAMISYTIMGEAGHFSSIWSPEESLDCMDCDEAIASPIATTVYSVTAINDLGCFAVDSVTVFVKQANEVLVPNAFTPNGDGQNDEFQIFGSFDAVRHFEVQIFNRWGEKLFESFDRNFKWDGTYRGKLLPPDVYVYHIRMVFTDNIPDRFKKGSVALIR